MSPERGLEQNEYDYVICGGGTTGCVVAARLAEDSNLRILVIEAGPDGNDNENSFRFRKHEIKMVGGWSKNFDTESDWSIVSTPQPGIDGRQVKLSRGKFLGGSSGVNGTLVVKGSKQDYDDWGLSGWSGEEMFECMNRAEVFHNKPWFDADPSAHGTNGLLHTEPHDLAPISELLLKSMESQGLTYDADMFAHGNKSHGCGHSVRTHHNGLRSIGADFIRNENRRDNVDVICDTIVDKIIFDESLGEAYAAGVVLIGKDGKRTNVTVRKEVIISGGSYCSPAILLRSGIGPRHQLERLGIRCIVNLPGVGQNLLDHMIVFTFYEVSKDGLTNDHLVYHGDAAMAAYMLYKEQKTGVLSTFPFGVFAFARLDERLKDDPLWKDSPRQPGRDPMGLTQHQPNIELFTTELYGGPLQYDKFPIDMKHAFAMITELFSPRSKGSVTLASANPLENPVVDCNYLSDPLDLLVLSEGVRFGNEIVMQGVGTKDVVKGSWPSDLTHHAFTKREEWIPHVKQHATTCYHPAGTCKMGVDSDKMAVLNEKLQVRGVKRLRVADCSVMPSLHGGHTQMPAYGIGEKAADLIKDAARKTTT